jgi:hypothetical protein
MSRAWEAAGHGVPTGRSVSRVLLFLVGDRTFTSWVLNPATVHGDVRWRTSSPMQKYKGKLTSVAAIE